MSAPVVIKRSRGKAALAVGGCLLFILGSLLMIRTGDAVGLVIGTVGMVTFGTFGVLWVALALRRGPGLVVSDEGFVDESSGVSAGRVPWTDVTRVTRWGAEGSQTIVVHVRNPGEHLSRMGWFARRAARANITLVGSPVTLTANGLKTDADQLHDLIAEGFERHRARSPEGWASPDGPSDRA